MNRQNEYRVNSIIDYRASDGSIRRVRVEEKSPNIKNGRPGFDGTLISSSDSTMGEGDGVWGYDEQIVRVFQK